VVLQDVFLFSGDIKGNIGLGDESIADDRIKAAARIVGANKFIERLPKQYDEEVKERGATLSVGQKQLISFARALAYNPKILVLDEATSSVDTETELLIQSAIKKLLHGRTSIVIAHRLSTIQSANKIIVMHKGEIREMGTHQELLAHGGIYYKLYQLQYKEQEIKLAV
jgi:ABC-type multidrug transport system fused ATPase/permease subunit